MLNEKSHHIESIIQNSALIYSYTLQKEQLSVHSGYVEGEVLFVKGYRLSFFEFYYAVGNALELDKYRYHFMDCNNNLVFRYDNAPHHKDIESFPHHKHLPNKVASSNLLTFSELIEEIEDYVLGEF
jgi:hypothetical protein